MLHRTTGRLLPMVVIASSSRPPPPHILQSNGYRYRSIHSFLPPNTRHRFNLHRSNINDMNSFNNQLSTTRRSNIYPNCHQLFRWYSSLSLSRNSFLSMKTNTLLCSHNNIPTETSNQKVRIGQIHIPQSSLQHVANREQRMYYHTTKKQEIIPVIVIGAAIVVIGIRYSYRALQRMKEEQEDYQYNLQIYERQQMKYHNTEQPPPPGATTTATGMSSSSSTNGHNGGPVITMAVDLGTTYMKLATATYRPLSPVTVQISREGDRSTFNGVLYEYPTESDGKQYEPSHRIVKATGRAALERYYYPNTMDDGPSYTTTQRPQKDIISMPFLEFSTTTTNDTSSSFFIVTDVLQSRVKEVMDRIHSSITTTTAANTNQKALVRHVVTVPSIFLYSSDSFLKLYQNSFIDCCTKYNVHNDQQQQHFDTESLRVTFIPDPIATIWGAQFYNLLPSNLSKDLATVASYLIIDVGGWTTQLSMVQNDKIKYTITIPWGGECIIEQLVLVLKKQQQQLGNISSSLNDSRSLSLLQYHARQAVMGLASQSRAKIHVPYLYADPKHHHMETDIARNVLNQAVEDNIRDLLKHQPEKNDGQVASTTSPWLSDAILSPHLPTPNNLTSLWTSILTQVLERSGQLPTTVSAVVLVGGGSKYAYVQTTIKDAWDMLTGGISGSGGTQFHFDSSLSSELTVVGAATLPPSFDYSLTDGLVRR
jgi:hypothetical protein